MEAEGSGPHRKEGRGTQGIRFLAKNLAKKANFEAGKNREPVLGIVSSPTSDLRNRGAIGLDLAQALHVRAVPKDTS